MAGRFSLPDKIPTGPAVGALVGLLLMRGKWIGALLGAIAGYMIESRLRGRGPTSHNSRSQPSSAPITMNQAPHFVRLLVAVARASGGYDERARAAARTCFATDARLDASSLEAIDALLEKAASRAPEPPKDAARAWLAAAKLERKERIRILFSCFRVSLALGPLGGAREQALRDVADGLDLDHSAFADLRAEFVMPTGDRASADDYRALELEPGASLESVRERYREAVKTYHPDRFQHLGSAFADVAAEKFKAIQAAYERIVAAHETKGAQQQVLASRCPNCRKFTAAQDERCIRCDTQKLMKKAGKTCIRCAFCGHANPLGKLPPDVIQSCEICRVLLVR